MNQLNTEHRTLVNKSKSVEEKRLLPHLDHVFSTNSSVPPLGRISKKSM